MARRSSSTRINLVSGLARSTNNASVRFSHIERSCSALLIGPAPAQPPRSCTRDINCSPFLRSCSLLACLALFLTRHPQGLPHSVPDRHEGVPLGRGGIKHPVMTDGNGEPCVWVRPPNRPTCTRMANSARVAPNDRRRRRRLAAQPEPAHTEIQRAPDDGIELLSVRTRHAERAHALLRQEANTAKVTAIGQHGKKRG